ncbi:MAG: hypothetical protein CVV36_08465 [Candidatus Methanoperedenaceae archaeon HGW-Methanoperedenaceae-1]|nr:MAG: hypothetical protein CVV36_08465 [Candidatus Methanoperedenaceae archaeon HGW-Methanoperedenaceae-1]
MAATLDNIYKELKHLRDDIQELKDILVPEVEPEHDEIEAIQEGIKEISSGKYTEWKSLKAGSGNV